MSPGFLVNQLDFEGRFKETGVEQVVHPSTGRKLLLLRNEVIVLVS